MIVGKKTYVFRDFYYHFRVEGPDFKWKFREMMFIIIKKVKMEHS